MSLCWKENIKTLYFCNSAIMLLWGQQPFCGEQNYRSSQHTPAWSSCQVFRAVMGSAKCTRSLLRAKVTAKSMTPTERALRPSHLWPWTSFCCGIFRDLLAVARLSQPLDWDTQSHMELGSVSKARVCSTHIPRSYCLLLGSLSCALWNETYFWNLAAVNFLSWSLVLTASASGKHDYHFKRTAILEKVMFALQRKNILTSAPWSNRTNV